MVPELGAVLPVVHPSPGQADGRPHRDTRQAAYSGCEVPLPLFLKADDAVVVVGVLVGISLQGGGDGGGGGDHWDKSILCATNIKEQIEVFYLPSYSPELNPDEYLNGDLKTGVHSGIPARSEKDLTKKTRSFMKKLQKRPHHVRNYFKHPKIAYAA
jgi:hypothetical protein